MVLKNRSSDTGRAGVGDPGRGESVVAPSSPRLFSLDGPFFPRMHLLLVFG